MFKKIKTDLEINAELIEAALSKHYNLPDHNLDNLIKAQRYGLLGGGKRIRAFLTMEICKLFGGKAEAAMPYACAIEMIHASSLIHDDLPCMDNDDFRRGKPSTHKVYGENIALLAGDCMMVKAFEVIINNPYSTDETNAQAIRILCESTGSNGMLAGQGMDVYASNNKLDFESLISLHRHKTGCLISASAKLGCLAAGIELNSEKFKSAVEYSESIGLAFQIIDDILDYLNGQKELNSFLSFMTLEEARKYAKDLTQHGIDAIKAYDDGTLRDLAEYLIFREY